ncbi:MAG: PadR family transcriptional regulator [Cellulomonas sp.]|uniref:PadR family transcriptional regulator n=1 Tax=Cellulomonas sp. TaxID=40001 RepID=UPI00180F67D2|nr:PadR family transcriptional regulator [Cellulomonas sp.]NMM30885.1 PadR family transcriptional regulator [Cellulomonas sp.]
MHTHDTHPGRFTGRQMPHDPRAGWQLAGDGPRDHSGRHDGPGSSPADSDGDGRGPRRHGHGERLGGFGPMGFGPTGFGPGAFGPGGPRRRGRRPGRGGRGDVRAAILLLLVEGPMHGYQLIQQISERSGGAWTPSPGSVYPALSQLEDEGLVHLERVEGRNTASLTDVGTTYVQEHQSDLGTPWDDANDSVSSEVRDLRDEVGALMTAAQQVSHVGAAAQVAEASRLLIQVRKALYRILADDESQP